jgi:phosphonate transport system permease protein
MSTLNLNEHDANLKEQFPQYFATFSIARVKTLFVLLALLIVLVIGIHQLEIKWDRIFIGMQRLGDIVILMFPPDPGWGPLFKSYIDAMVETISIAFLGTFMAAIIAIPLSLLAARNTNLNRLLQYLSRRTFDTLRGIDILIWALIWINVVGLGPFAGVLAIICSDVGSFGKLFSEALEAVDKNPTEGIQSSGGNRLQQIQFGVIPQVLPVFFSQILYFFESNTRSATIIGIVGAGGVGFILSEQIRSLEFQQLSFVILLILITVSLIDLLSARLRHALIQPH